MDKFKKSSIILLSSLIFTTVFNEIFMSLWTRGFWNTTNLTFYCGVNFILLAIILQVGIAWYEQLYGEMKTPITIKQAIQRLRSVI